MSVVETYPLADPFVLQILRQLCHALSPVKALRRRRTPKSPRPLRNSAANTSCSRRGLQSSIEVLNIAFSVAETIPVVSPPLKGALEALCKILGQVEVSSGSGGLWYAAHWRARVAEVPECGGGCEAYREARRPRPGSLYG
jgi:hypothetical protein